MLLHVLQVTRPSGRTPASHRRTGVRPVAALRLALAASALALCAWPASAKAPRQGWLEVKITIDAEQTWQSGRDSGRSAAHETYEIRYPLVTDGDRLDVHPFVRTGKTAPASSVSPATQAQAASQQKTIAEEMRRKAEACGGRQDCLLAVAMEASRRSAEPQSRGTPVAPANEGPLLHYRGAPECRAEVRITVNNTADSSYADVQGMVPVHEEQRATAWTGDDNTRGFQCSQQQVVHAIERKRISLFTLLLPSAKGLSVRTEGGRTRWRREDGQVGVGALANDWLHSQIEDLPLSGTLAATLPLNQRSLVGTTTANATFRGQAKVTFTWAFRP